MSPQLAVDRAQTAIGRSGLSRPLRIALDAGLIRRDAEVFDYGCGRGDDVRFLTALGICATGWDPVHRPNATQRHADAVNLGYVVNVIEDPVERDGTLRAAWELTRKILLVSARLSFEASGHFCPFGDGRLTNRGTFQKYFTQGELREWIERTLDIPSVAVGPGVFVVFRDRQERETFVETRERRARNAPQVRKSDVLFETHRPLLDPLVRFLTSAGRLPSSGELAEAEQIKSVFGSLKRAFGVIRHVTGREQWDTIREERRGEILRYLALSRFGGQPRFGELPLALQLDVREFFGTYRRACELANRLLFSAGDPTTLEKAVREAGVGKLTPSALYIHVSALHELPLVLQVYEGCARAYVGVVDSANIIKLYRREPAVSYLAYPDFESNPHPAVVGALHVGLRSLSVRYRDYSRSKSPPILHRKDAFVSQQHPLRPKFERLTMQEQRLGLLSDTSRIGTRGGWERRLEAEGFKLRGHRLVRSH